MADAILGADQPVRKSTSPEITNLPERWTALEGLVADPHVDLDTQLAVLGLVDETGSATMGDLVSILPRHPNPAQAIAAFVRKGVLRIEPGLIDAQSLVHRRVSPPVRAVAAGSPGMESAHRDGSGGRGKVHHLKSLAPEPDIFFASGIDRSYFAGEPRLRRRGIYVALYGSTAYVGRSGDTACRIAWGAHLRAHGVPDRIIAAVDRHGVMSEAQARVCERLGARMVDKDPQLTLLNGTLPAGDRLERGLFEQSARFVAALFERSRAAGLFDVPASNATAGAVAERETEGDTDPVLFSLEACGVSARARLEDGKWLVLAGSEVRRDTVPSASPAAMRLRQELLYEQGLLPQGDSLVLTEDLAFDSAAGAANFVAGSRVKPQAWRPVEDPAAMPRP